MTRSHYRLLVSALVLAAFALAGCDDDENGPIIPNDGSLRVIVTTTGDGIDPDGYTVTIDGVGDRAVAVNDTVTFEDVAAGDHEVALGGVATNCLASGMNPRTVAVSAGQTASTTFEVACSEATLSNQIAFYRQGTGVVVMEADGSNPTVLVRGTTPAVSPNGTRIAFVTSSGEGGEIAVMNADGTGAQQLTDNAADDCAPVWSPDGAKIAFYSDRDGDLEIYVMNADGTGQTRLTNRPGEDINPTWSPDGTRIAYTSFLAGEGRDIVIMNADGTGVVNISNTPGEDENSAAWAPSTRIAYHTTLTGGADIYVMNPDGSGRMQVTQGPAFDQDPTWSPDGTRIAFESLEGGDYEICVIGADGSGLVNLTGNPAADDREPSWSP